MKASSLALCLFPRSQTPVWERDFAKLPFRARSLDRMQNGSFAECVPKQEFGNEGNEEKYESKEKTPTIGSAFEGVLTVGQGGKKRSIVWNGDSNTPDSLGAALTELRKLADGVNKARNK